MAVWISGWLASLTIEPDTYIKTHYLFYLWTRQVKLFLLRNPFIHNVNQSFNKLSSSSSSSSTSSFLPFSQLLTFQDPFFFKEPLRNFFRADIYYTSLHSKKRYSHEMSHPIQFVSRERQSNAGGVSQTTFFVREDRKKCCLATEIIATLTKADDPFFSQYLMAACSRSCFGCRKSCLDRVGIEQLLLPLLLLLLLQL